MRHGWSLSPAVWAGVREAFEHRRWSRVPFQMRSRVMVPNACGIYVLAAGPGVGQTGALARLYDALYVGQSTNLRVRFLQHLSHPQPQIERATRCFAMDFWFTCSEEHERYGLEALLIDCLGPSANRIPGIRATIGQPVGV